MMPITAEASAYAERSPEADAATVVDDLLRMVDHPCEDAHALTRAIVHRWTDSAGQVLCEGDRVRLDTPLRGCRAQPTARNCLGTVSWITAHTIEVLMDAAFRGGRPWGHSVVIDSPAPREIAAERLGHARDWRFRNPTNILEIP
jgi:hypothetical protein